jgi:malate/lactate dehydrogenase
MITIIGAGKVGSEAAFNILKERISDVVLIDLNQELAQGEALDMMQETLANIIEGFSKTLKGTDVTPERIEVKIKRLHGPVNVDAHTYP